MPPAPIHLHIADVLTEVPASAGVEAGLVVLSEDDPPYRSLRIIIGPAETRSAVAAALRMLASKREKLHARKHGNTPL